jgi:hypothetical protein
VCFLLEPTFRNNISLQLLVTAKVSNSLILSTVMIEVSGFSESSVVTRATWRHIQEDDILYNLGMYENTVERSLFGPKRDEVIIIISISISINGLQMGCQSSSNVNTIRHNK